MLCHALYTTRDLDFPTLHSLVASFAHVAHSSLLTAAASAAPRLPLWAFFAPVFEPPAPSYGNSSSVSVPHVVTSVFATEQPPPMTSSGFATRLSAYITTVGRLTRPDRQPWDTTCCNEDHCCWADGMSRLPAACTPYEAAQTLLLAARDAAAVWWLRLSRPPAVLPPCARIVVVDAVETTGKTARAACSEGDEQFSDEVDEMAQHTLPCTALLEAARSV